MSRVDSRYLPVARNTVLVTVRSCQSRAACVSCVCITPCGVCRFVKLCMCVFVCLCVTYTRKGASGVLGLHLVRSLLTLVAGWQVRAAVQQRGSRQVHVCLCLCLCVCVVCACMFMCACRCLSQML